MKFGHINKFSTAACVAVVSLLSGCSSMVNGTTQKVTVRAMTQEKTGMVKVNPDAVCQSTNSNGTFESRSTDLVEVHRDNVPLVSVCSHADKAGKTSTESQFRANRLLATCLQADLLAWQLIMQRVPPMSIQTTSKL